MAIAVRGTATTGTATATAPPGSTTGDVLMVVAIAPSATPITVPTGWTTQLNVTTSTSYSTLRLVLATAPWSAGLAMGFTGATLNICAAYSGCNTSSPFQGGNDTLGGSASTIATPTVNDSTSNGWRVGAWGMSDTSFSGAAAWATFSPTDTIRGKTNTSTYSIALTDSNTTISTGNTSVTGTVPDASFASYVPAIAWLGILVPVGGTPTSAPDTGSADDEIQLGIQEAETGSGAEAAPISATVPTPETGAGTESQTIVPTAPGDAGSGAEAETTAAPIADTGAGAESQSIIPTMPGDSGSGAETAQQAATVGAPDTGSGAEAATVGPQAPDSGSGAETAPISATVPTPETSAGTEAETTAVGASETGSGTEGETTAVPTPDAGSGAESTTPAAQIPTADTGSGTEGETTAVPTPDTGAGTEAISVGVAVPMPDTGSGTEAAQLGPGLPDTGSADETGISFESGWVVPADVDVYVVQRAYRVYA